MFIAESHGIFQCISLAKPGLNRTLIPSLKYVKRWLHLSQNANISYLYHPTKHLGLKFSLPSEIYACCQLQCFKMFLVDKS